jgi:ankyrin repeat protein
VDISAVNLVRIIPLIRLTLSQFNFTAFDRACLKGHVEVVTALLQNGVNVNLLNQVRILYLSLLFSLTSIFDLTGR